MRAVGLVILLIGIVLTIDLLAPGGHRPFFGLLGILGPFLFTLGGLLILGDVAPRAVLVIGLVLLAVGGFPWFYTPWLMGTRGGDEGSGMLGTIIFIFVGLPGLIATLVGLFYTVFGRD
jgi:hypothetical protein